MYPFEYEVTIYDSLDREITKRHGVTIAKSYKKAVEFIEKYYEEELIDITITSLEESSIYEFELTKEDFCHGMYKIEFSKW